ncbi:hypothetical protein EBX93_00975 [bacterium]|nr:hypothetical protein [bacterium]
MLEAMEAIEQPHPLVVAGALVVQPAQEVMLLEIQQVQELHTTLLQAMVEPVLQAEVGQAPQVHHMAEVAPELETTLAPINLVAQGLRVLFHCMNRPLYFYYV